MVQKFLALTLATSELSSRVLDDDRLAGAPGDLIAR